MQTLCMVIMSLKPSNYIVKFMTPGFNSRGRLLKVNVLLKYPWFPFFLVKFNTQWQGSGFLFSGGVTNVAMK